MNVAGESKIAFAGGTVPLGPLKVPDAYLLGLRTPKLSLGMFWTAQFAQKVCAQFISFCETLPPPPCESCDKEPPCHEELELPPTGSGRLLGLERCLPGSLERHGHDCKSDASALHPGGPGPALRFRWVRKPQTPPPAASGMRRQARKRRTDSSRCRVRQ